MVGPHYDSEQRTFMAVEYCKKRGTRDFMEEIIADFQVRYPAAIPPSCKTIWRQWYKLDHFHTLHNLNSKVIRDSSIQFLNALPFHRQALGRLIVEDPRLQ